MRAYELEAKTFDLASAIYKVRVIERLLHPSDFAMYRGRLSGLTATTTQQQQCKLEYQ
jgi:hypothetical protein